MPDPDTLPTPADPTGPCPRCGRISNFRNDNQMNLVMGLMGTEEAAYVMRCMGCSEALVVVMDGDGQGLHWYPAPGAGTLDEAVDAKVASCYSEGMLCLGIGATRAAAVMFRSALHCFIKDKGSEPAKAERHLKVALKHMRNDGALHKSLWGWADELNQLGNEAAHPEDYDEVTPAEAKALGDFVRQLIRLEYEMEAQLERARARDAAAIAAEQAEDA